MGNGAVKTIVMLMVLVVLSAIIGSQFSGSLSESYGAFYVIAAIVAFYGMVFLGDKCWMLVYILPAMLCGLPFVRHAPIAFAVSDAVLVCCIVMWFMRHLKFHWSTVWGIDLVVLIFVGLMVANFIRFPVSINALGFDYEYVGGLEYAWCVSAVIHYIAISAVTPRSADIPKLIKWCMILMLLMQIPYSIQGLAHRRALLGDDERYPFFYVTGATLLYYGYARLPMRQLLFSLKSLAMILVGIVMLLCTGGRESFLRGVLAAVLLPFLKKELTAAFVLTCMLYGGILVLSSTHQTEMLPYGAQRVLTLIPGVQVESGIAQGTKGTSDTRRMIWALGLDPRTGLIKDYIWGDGFQRHRTEVARTSVANLRGSSGFMKGGHEQAYYLASNNSWHNGWLTMVKRLGLVGLVSVNIMFLTGLFFIAKVSSAYLGSKDYAYCMAMCLPFASIALTFVFGTQTFQDVFATFMPLGYIKMLYCAAREQGKIRPLFLRETYVPMVIREQENRIATAR